jgi:hypothetical protein
MGIAIDISERRKVEEDLLISLQKEKELSDWREKYDTDIADLNAQIDRLNAENELLTKTLCEQQVLYTQTQPSVDSIVETSPKESAFETQDVERKEEVLSREFEHHLILSAWNSLREQLVMRVD